MEKISKEQIIKDFDKWLGDEFDKNNKDSPGETHRWLFCWNGEEPHEPGFDCACCITDEKGEGCGCICHERVESIVDYFIKYFNENK